MSSQFGGGDYRYEVAENWGRSQEWPRFGVVSSAAVDSQDNVYVFQRTPEGLIIVFDRQGNFLRSWGAGTFVEAHGIWIGPDDTIYTADSLDHTVRRFTSDGELIWTLGTPGQTGNPGSPFNRPTWAVVAPSGDLYVSDGYGQNRWHRFDSDRRLLDSWGETGSGPGQFLLPHAVWVDRNNRVYVLDRANLRIQIFTSGRRVPDGVDRDAVAQPAFHRQRRYRVHRPRRPQGRRDDAGRRSPVQLERRGRFARSVSRRAAFNLGRLTRRPLR